MNDKLYRPSDNWHCPATEYAKRGARGHRFHALKEKKAAGVLYCRRCAIRLQEPTNA